MHLILRAAPIEMTCNINFFLYPFPFLAMPIRPKCRQPPSFLFFSYFFCRHSFPAFILRYEILPADPTIFQLCFTPTCTFAWSNTCRYQDEPCPATLFLYMKANNRKNGTSNKKIYKKAIANWDQCVRGAKLWSIELLAEKLWIEYKVWDQMNAG
jgi:hypothetical protein